MPRMKRADLEDLADMGREILSLIDDLKARYRDDDSLFGELQQLSTYAQIFINKGERLPRLRDFRGYKFAIIDEATGEPRAVTRDEALRLLMDYKTGSAIDIYREWTVIDGKWVKRPSVNPDGTRM